MFVNPSPVKLLQALSAALLAAAALAAPAPAQSGIEDPTSIACEKPEGEGPVVVRTAGRSAGVTFVRTGNSLDVRGTTWQGDPLAVACGPGTLGLDEVTRVVLDDGTFYPTSVHVDQSRGAFEPGAGAEPGSAEVEFDLSEMTAGFNSFELTGRSDRRNEVVLGQLPGGGDGIDLNGDGDLDIAGGRAESKAIYAGPHGDRLDATGDDPRFAGQYGSPAFKLVGGPGDDVLLPGSAPGFHSGGPGDDLLYAYSAASLPAAGPGRDTISFARAGEEVTVDLRRRGARDAENLVGGPATDIFDGSDAANRIDLRDGRPDIVACHGGRDTVLADAPGVDQIAPDCERVLHRGGPAPGPPLRLAVAKVEVPERAQRLIRHGVRVKARCNRPCRLRIVLSTGAGAVRRGLPWVLGRRSRRIRGGRARWVHVPLTRLAKGALRHGFAGTFRLRTTIRAFPVAGGGAARPARPHGRSVVRRVG